MNSNIKSIKNYHLFRNFDKLSAIYSTYFKVLLYSYTSFSVVVKKSFFKIIYHLLLLFIQKKNFIPILSLLILIAVSHPEIMFRHYFLNPNFYIGVIRADFTIIRLDFILVIFDCIKQRFKFL